MESPLLHKARDKVIVSRNMSAIRREGSSLERRLASAMWQAGLRYRKQYPVTGRPDFAFPRMKIAVFCDSEFWHGYGWGESRKAEFRTNPEFWISKIERNIQRDRDVDDELTRQRWTVLRFWGREINHDIGACVGRVMKAMASAGKPV